ncbi:MAG: rhomboid family intramembrane serine protease [Flavisolibacter sp.]
MSNFRFTRPDNFPPIVKNLIIINVLVYLAQISVGKQWDLTERISMYPIIPAQLKQIVMNSPALQPYYGFQPYQIATHMFAHSPETIFHIIFNMFGLWMFGRILENVWGGKRFLLFYLICGVGAAACQLLISSLRCEQLLHAFQSNNVEQIQNLSGAVGPALGASGAIMGIFAAFGYLFPNTELYIMFIPVPVKAKWAMLGLAAIDLFGGVANFSGDNVAHFAHLGGAITGFILVLIWNKTNRQKFY